MLTRCADTVVIDGSGRGAKRVIGVSVGFGVHIALSAGGGIVRRLALAFLFSCGGDAAVDAGVDATVVDAASDVTKPADAQTDAQTDASTDVASLDATDASADVVFEAGADTGADGGCDGGCYACCEAEDPDATASLLKHAFACACGSASLCAAPCSGTLCKSTTPDTTCMQCLTAHPDAGNCILSAEPAACGDADVGCQGVVACLEACP